MLRYVRASKLLLLPVLNIHSQVSCPNWDNCVLPRIFFGSFAMCFPFSQNRILLFSSFPFIFMHMFFTFTHLQGSTAKFSLLLSHPGYILNVSAGQVYEIFNFAEQSRPRFFKCCKCFKILQKKMLLAITAPFFLLSLLFPAAFSYRVETAEVVTVLSLTVSPQEQPSGDCLTHSSSEYWITVFFLIWPISTNNTLQIL